MPAATFSPKSNGMVELSESLSKVGSSTTSIDMTLVFILSVFIWDLQCKSHFNRKMVFRVTKSQSIKDKLSFI